MKASSLPRNERTKIDVAARIVVKSFEPGCRPIRAIHLIGHADRDVRRGPGFERKISGERALEIQKALTSAIAAHNRSGSPLPGASAQATRIMWRRTAAGASQPVVPNPQTEADRARNRRVEIVMTTAPSTPDPPDMTDPRIDVGARRALVRMLRGDHGSRTDATGMLSAVKVGHIAGMYGDDRNAAAILARKLNTTHARLVPTGEDAALVLDAANPMGSPPTIIFRAQVRAVPARLDPALRKAWSTYLLMRTGKLVRCDIKGADTPAAEIGLVAPSLALPLGNLVPPILCRVRSDGTPQDPWATTDATSNVLLFPSPPGKTRNGTLAHLQGGLVTDTSLRPRVSVVVGPGCTLFGIAQRLLPLYTSAAGTQSSAPPPTADELARGLAIYSGLYLPLPDMRTFLDGLRLPLPIEIDQTTGEWILNSNLIRTWANSFPATSRQALIRRTGHLNQPDPTALSEDVRAFLQSKTDALQRGIHLQARVASNPFEAVFFLFETFRQLGSGTFDVALVFMDNSVNHQIELLSTLTAGNAILRRIESALASAPAGLSSQRQQSLQRARSMLDHALRPGSILTVARELPETPQQLANRPGHVPFQDTGRRDPAGGRHRIVLGRDVLAGTVGSFTDTSGHTFQGPAFGGRMPPRVFIRDNRQLLNPGNDPRLTGRLDVVQAIAINEGFLDAIRMQDAGILSTGMQQWSAHADLELAALLHRYKSRSPDEYMLYFGLYGLEVRAFLGQNGANSFMLQRVQPNGASADLPLAQRRAFFGGTTSGNVTSFRTDWAARVREASLTSISYRATQILEAAARFDRVLREVGRIAVTLNGGHIRMPLNQLITSQFGVALILDAHINQPAHVPSDLQRAARLAGSQPDAASLDRVISARYATIRRTQNTSARTANIRAQGLNANHGSFTGW